MTERGLVLFRSTDAEFATPGVPITLSDEGAQQHDILKSECTAVRDNHGTLSTLENLGNKSIHNNIAHETGVRSVSSQNLTDGILQRMED